MDNTLFTLPERDNGGLKFRTKTNKERSEKIRAAKKALVWPPNYHICQTTADLGRIASLISRHRYFAFDTETSGTDAFSAECYCISIFVGGQGFLINFKHPLLPIIDSKEFVAVFQSYFLDSDIEKICFNASFDCHILESNFGLQPGYINHDPQTASWLIVQDLPQGKRKLKRLAEMFLGYKELETYEEKFGMAAFIVSEPYLAAHYAILDAELHYKLHKEFEKRLKKVPALWDLYTQMEMPVQNIDFGIEKEGFLVDKEYLQKELQQGLVDRLEELVQEMIKLGMPKDLDIASPKAVGQFFFEELRLPRILGNSTSIVVLEEIKDRHPIIPLFMDWRTTFKLKTGFADPLAHLSGEGIIRPSIKPTATGTGRSGSYDPNLYQMPAKVGPMIRKSFIAEKDYIIVSKDFKGQELRIMSYFAGRGPLRDIILEDRDIYAETAAVFYKVPADTLVKGDIRRDTGKKAFLAKQYLAQGFKIAKIFNAPKSEGDKFVDDFNRRFWDLHAFNEMVIEFSHKNGYVPSISGRRRGFDYNRAENDMQRWALEREANNMAIQGTAADQVKLAFIDCHNYLKENYPRSRVKLRIHDELIFWIHKDDWSEELSLALDEKMIRAIPELSNELPFVTTTSIYPPGPDGISRWGMEEKDYIKAA